MNNFIRLSDEQKRSLITQTAMRTGLQLQIIFSLPFADRLIFKGGTSLSKVWGLISRFSVLKILTLLLIEKSLVRSSRAI